MEEKTVKKYDSFWPFSRGWDRGCFSFSSSNYLSHTHSYAVTSEKGFTLIEMIVDIGILLVLFGMVVFLIDPGKQLSKAKDGQRREDFKQIRTALDTYYNDYNCYPPTLPFGQEWRAGQALYMKQVPQDPSCSSSSNCYTYVVDENTSCPQWHVLFGKLAQAPSPNAPGCLLQEDTCLPSDYAASGYNFCDFGGDITCDTLQAISLGTTTPVVTATPTVAQNNPVNTPIPTSAPDIPPDGIFYCACGANHVTVCNISYNIPENVTYYLDAQCGNQCGSPC